MSVDDMLGDVSALRDPLAHDANINFSRGFLFLGVGSGSWCPLLRKNVALLKLAKLRCLKLSQPCEFAFIGDAEGCSELRQGGCQDLFTRVREVDFGACWAQAG